MAVIGPSGSGKTTLLNLIAGIRLPQKGKVVTAETDVTALGDAERRDFRIKRLGLIFQEFELLEYLTVLDNILLPYRITGALALEPAVRSRAKELAQEVGLADKLKRYVDQLSQGERQRVALCRSLLTTPQLILADEPTGNLDQKSGRQIMELFRELNRNGSTILLITHDNAVADAASRIVHIDDGQLTEARMQVAS